ncbi:MAG: rod shape-determining protein MreD [Candidatus Margulisiibacteriota bacterium]
MRKLKISLYLLAALVLQTVVFARLNFFGVVPDLVLVTVIIFAVKENYQATVLFAAAAGFLQDVLSAGIYLNTIVNILVATLVSTSKQSFLGDEKLLVAGLVAIFTPLLFVFEGLVFFVFYSRPFDLQHLIVSIVLGTLYNLLLALIFLPLTRMLLRD